MARWTIVVAGGVLVTACSGAAPPTPLPTSVPTVLPTSVAPTPATVRGTPIPDPTAGRYAGEDWISSASQYAVQTGESFLFHCPPAGTTYLVWGTDIYTSDSSVCTAAVHSGLISFEQGGDVTVEMLPGQESYTGTERNGVSSSSYGSWSSSFAFSDGSPSPPSSAAPPSTGAGSVYEELLSHVDSTIASTCTEVDPAAAGALAVANCEPEGVIFDPEIVVDDVVYLWFETLADAEDLWLEKNDLLGEPSQSDCATGSCVTGLTPEGALYGRFVCGLDTVYGGDVVAWWYDNRLNHVGSILLAEGGCTDAQGLMGAIASRQ